jgi:hypothetical protein
MNFFAPFERRSPAWGSMRALVSNRGKTRPKREEIQAATGPDLD